MAVSDMFSREEQFIVHFAFRYALGRASASPGIVAKYIRSNIDRLPTSLAVDILKEIESADYLGMEGIDDVTWNNLADDLRAYIREVCE